METIREKPSFRAAFKHRRCLIPADGFYEWERRNGKQAFHIHRDAREPFAFAGLWEQWQHDTETLYSCTIITTAANSLMQPVHERMPLIISPAHYHDWLNKDANAVDAYQLLDDPTYTSMVVTPVGDWVNNPRHDDERCIAPI
jgi:putative SOS response-associated peptidase YedK